METGSRRRKSIPESIVVEVIARLPLKSIARFKSVSKRWRSLIESSYFRSLFHRNSSSSSSWSLMSPINYNSPITEAISFYGCERWDLPKSPASYIMPYQQLPNLGYYYYVSSSHGLVWIAQIYDDNGTRSAKSFLGNPVLQERIEVPLPPDPDTMPYSLVTRLVNGVVSSFKVVRTCYETIEPRDGTYVWWSMYVYSSETGRWAFKRLWSSCPLQRSDFSRPLNLNGTVYVWEKRLDDDDDDTAPGVIVSYDFYAEEGDDQCRVIPLPVPYNKNVRRCLTTSGGDVIYVEILDRRLKVWKMRNNSSDGEWWQLTWKEIHMASLGFDVNCFPLGMNPFDAHLVYLWSRQHGCVVSGNLKTLEFTLHQETETWSDSDGCWRINTSDSKKRMEAIYDPASVITLSQFVLPQWMDPVPHPPN